MAARAVRWAGLHLYRRERAADYLIESILYPNRKIKEGYHSVVVETKDDRSLVGVQVSETGSEIVLRDAADKLVSIPRNQVKRKINGQSLMPPALILA